MNLMRQTFVALSLFGVYTLALVSLSLLTGCTPVKYIVDCTVVQPQNCN